MKVNFIRKPTPEELIPQDEFIVEKTIVLESEVFEGFIRDPLNDYDFIKEYLDLMYCDKEGIFHCLLVTSDIHDFGILVESEGYHYARYAAFIPLFKTKTEK